MTSLHITPTHQILNQTKCEMGHFRCPDGQPHITTVSTRQPKTIQVTNYTLVEYWITALCVFAFVFDRTWPKKWSAGVVKIRSLSSLVEEQQLFDAVHSSFQALLND